MGDSIGLHAPMQRPLTPLIGDLKPVKHVRRVDAVGLRGRDPLAIDRFDQIADARRHVGGVKVVGLAVLDMADIGHHAAGMKHAAEIGEAGLQKIGAGHKSGNARPSSLTIPSERDAGTVTS